MLQSSWCGIGGLSQGLKLSVLRGVCNLVRSMRSVAVSRRMSVIRPYSPLEVAVAFQPLTKTFDVDFGAEPRSISKFMVVNIIQDGCGERNDTIHGGVVYAVLLYCVVRLRGV